MRDGGDRARRIIALGATAAVMLCLPANAGAEPVARETCLWSAKEPGQAQLEFRELDRAIRAPLSEQGVPGVVARLRRLMATPCFRGQDDGWGLPSFESSVPLVQWWKDGGDSWIKGALGGLGERSEQNPELPPDARKTLHLEGHEKHPLASLLCRAADRTCGRETASWLFRAEDVLKHAQRFVPRPSRTSEEHEQLCASPAGRTPADRYRSWRICVDNHRNLFSVLPPLGTFRAPTRGWLVVRGRRGHYEYCDTLSAYDLQTGAAFRSRLCGRLFGDPFMDAPDAGPRKPVFERGQVPVDQLREAALVIMLWPEMQHDVARSVDWFKRPDGLRPVALPPAPRPARDPSPTYGGSGDTSLSWQWLAGKRLASGELLYAPELKRQDGYPSWLLAIAEAGFEARCPPTKLPDGALAGRATPGSVSFLDASQQQLDDIEVELGLALQAGAAEPCQPAETR